MARTFSSKMSISQLHCPRSIFIRSKFSNTSLTSNLSAAIKLVLRHSPRLHVAAVHFLYRKIKSQHTRCRTGMSPDLQLLEVGCEFCEDWQRSSHNLPCHGPTPRFDTKWSACPWTVIYWTHFSSLIGWWIHRNLSNRMESTRGNICGRSSLRLHPK